ncbi:hypothetical protein ABBQ38_015416 [Trebouxia sp. C0009 RCD-2024]
MHTHERTPPSEPYYRYVLRTCRDGSAVGPAGGALQLSSGVAYDSIEICLKILSRQPQQAVKQLLSCVGVPKGLPSCVPSWLSRASTPGDVIAVTEFSSQHTQLSSQHWQHPHASICQHLAGFSNCKHHLTYSLDSP